MNAWAHLEAELSPEPQFFVQAPDGRKDWAETPRQTVLFKTMRMAAPRVLGFPIPNAGKRNPMQARREGIMAGIFDTQWIWRDSLTAWIELKGYSKGGRPGHLTDQQIEFGNRLTILGVPCACFFDPFDAIDWLRGLGFPIREVNRAA